MLADLLKVGHGLYQLLAHVVGVGGEEPNALDASDFVKLGEEVRQVGPVGQVVAIGVHVLAQEGYLPDAPAPQGRHLLHQLWDGAAALPAPAIGDDAEGAELVAAVDDGNVGADLGVR